MTQARGSAAATALRLAWLIACLGAGVLVGLAVRALGGGDAGFLAIPALVLAGWLRLADPTDCLAQRGHTGGRRSGEG